MSTNELNSTVTSSNPSNPLLDRVLQCVNDPEATSRVQVLRTQFDDSGKFSGFACSIAAGEFGGDDLGVDPNITLDVFVPTQECIGCRRTNPEQLIGTESRVRLLSASLADGQVKIIASQVKGAVLEARAEADVYLKERYAVDVEVIGLDRHAGRGNAVGFWCRLADDHSKDYGRDDSCLKGLLDCLGKSTRPQIYVPAGEVNLRVRSRDVGVGSVLTVHLTEVCLTKDAALRLTGSELAAIRQRRMQLLQEPELVSFDVFDIGPQEIRLTAASGPAFAACVDLKRFKPSEASALRRYLRRGMTVLAKPRSKQTRNDPIYMEVVLSDGTLSSLTRSSGKKGNGRR